MSAVAELNHVKREHAKKIAEMTDALLKAAKQNFKLRQEVTGGLQVIAYMASQCPDRTLTIKAADLIVQAGTVQRKHDKEKDIYHFIFIPPPPPEEVADLQKHVEATNATHEPASTVFDVPPVPVGQDEPTEAELGQAALGE